MKISTWFVAVGAVCVAYAATAHELVDFSCANHNWRAANHVTNAHQTATGYAFDLTDFDPWCLSGSTCTMPPR